MFEIENANAKINSIDALSDDAKNWGIRGTLGNVWEWAMSNGMNIDHFRQRPPTMTNLFRLSLKQQKPLVQAQIHHQIWPVCLVQST